VSIKEPVVLTELSIHHQIIIKSSSNHYQVINVLNHISYFVLQYKLIDMAPAITTEIETPVFISTKAPRSSENHDVSTTLNYMKHPGPEGLKAIDSGVPESERRFAKRDELRDVQNVVIKDIRGREKDFRWDVEGFQYLHHEIHGVTDWTDPKQIREIIQPMTEELVKKV